MSAAHPRVAIASLAATTSGLSAGLPRSFVSVRNRTEGWSPSSSQSRTDLGATGARAFTTPPKRTRPLYGLASNGLRRGLSALLARVLATEAREHVVVHHADGLHVGIADCRAHEPEAPLLQCSAHRVRFGRSRGDLA